MKTDLEQKNYATPELPERLCDPRCSTCNSPYLKEIHELKNAGHSLIKIAEIVGQKFNFKTSSASLSRHFSAYEKHTAALTVQMMNDDLLAQASCRAYHSQELIKLIKKSFEHIAYRINAGTLHLDITDLDKVMKLYYQVMNGQDSNDNDIMAIFQKASNKYGLDLQQGVLFKPRSPVPAAEQER